MPYSEAQKRATAKYVKANLDDIKIRVPKGKREIYKAAAELAGKSLNQYIIDLIENDINSRQGGAVKATAFLLQ